MPTHYDLLNVTETAMDEVIRAAYRVLARRYHPDRNGNSTQSVQKMQALNEAYAILTDPVRRRQYDETLRDERQRYSRTQAAFQAQSASPPHYSTRRSRQPYEVRRSSQRFPQTMSQKLVAFLFNDPRVTLVLFLVLFAIGRQFFAKRERPYPSLPPSAYAHPYFRAPQ